MAQDNTSIWYSLAKVRFLFAMHMYFNSASSYSDTSYNSNMKQESICHVNTYFFCHCEPRISLLYSFITCNKDFNSP